MEKNYSKKLQSDLEMTPFRWFMATTDACFREVMTAIFPMAHQMKGLISLTLQKGQLKNIRTGNK